MEQPVYSFLGYSTNEIKYVNQHKENTYIGISIPNDYYDDVTKRYSIIVRVASDFAIEESVFVFQGTFQINDENWFNGLEKNIKKTTFFTIVFPYIREKILSITSDSNPGLFIPTISVRNIDFSKELKLIKA